MDPNACLSELRRLVEKHMHGMCDDDEIHRMAELVESLDSWLSAGGFLPTDWQKNRR